MARAITVREDRWLGESKMVQVDVTEPATDVEVLVNHISGVLHVNLDGYCVLRVCRVKNFVVMETENVSDG